MLTRQLCCIRCTVNYLTWETVSLLEILFCIFVSSGLLLEPEPWVGFTQDPLTSAGEIPSAVWSGSCPGRSSLVTLSCQFWPNPKLYVTCWNSGVIFQGFETCQLVMDGLNNYIPITLWKIFPKCGGCVPAPCTLSIYANWKFRPDFVLLNFTVDLVIIPVLSTVMALLMC